jgi:3-amino-4-hydroxybenzoic acid synthase
MTKNATKQLQNKHEKAKEFKDQSRLVWYDARDIQKEEVVLPLVYNSRIEYIIVKRKKVDTLNCPRKMKLIVEINKASETENLSKEHILLSPDIGLLQKLKDDGYTVAFYKQIDNEIDMDQAWKLGKSVDFIIVNFKDETNIPLELLIARLQGSNTIILKQVRTVQETEIAYGVMEVGSEGVVLCTSDLNEIKAMDNFIGKIGKGKVSLLKAKVIDVQHIGMGFRACIDTTDIMTKHEGMIIGSTSTGGLLVSSETHFLPYMELRPFRVNAGAVHSYVWGMNDMTAYLTELKAGSKVMCVDTSGNTREICVGRVKTEYRPLLKIEAMAGDIRINAIVQDDWHIRIFGADGTPRNASTIKIGEELLAYICEGGRHVGIKINEKIEEQ